MENCFGCGIRAERHPVVAIQKFDEKETSAVGTDPAKLWMAVPVCLKCHTDPAHRTLTIKGAFFMREGMELALRLADMQNVGVGR